MKQFSLSQLSFSYPTQPANVLRNVDLEIEEGEFVLLIGASGSGKSTLLRLLAGLLPEFTGGNISGEFLFEGKCAIADRNLLRERTGFVAQNPEDQQLFESVEREIAFALENRGRPNAEMQRRVAEVAQVLGFQEMLCRSTKELSSGELQKVMIGAALSAMPEVLILDEPGSQLSPYARQELMSLLGQLNRNYGITVILTEHHLEECFPFATRVIGLSDGEIQYDGAPEGCHAALPESFHSMLPSLVKLHSKLGGNGAPVSVKGCRAALGKTKLEQSPRGGVVKRKVVVEQIESAAELNRLSYAYDSRSFVLDDITASIKRGSLTAVVGENGAGKSTLLRLMAGWIQPMPKNIRVFGKTSYLSQDPNCYLLHPSVLEELDSVSCKDENYKQKVMHTVQLGCLLKCHPQDLSTGQRQRVALATVLLSMAPIILLDEPTRGLDPAGLEMLCAALSLAQKEANASIVLATHNIEFAASVSDNVLLLSRGRLLASGAPHVVFDNNLFFTTQVNRVFRGYCPQVITLADAECVLREGAHE